MPRPRTASQPRPRPDSRPGSTHPVSTQLRVRSTSNRCCSPASAAEQSTAVHRSSSRLRPTGTDAEHSTATNLQVCSCAMCALFDNQPWQSAGIYSVSPQSPTVYLVLLNSVVTVGSDGNRGRQKLLRFSPKHGDHPRFGPGLTSPPLNILRLRRATPQLHNPGRFGWWYQSFQLASVGPHGGICRITEPGLRSSLNRRPSHSTPQPRPQSV